MKDISSDKLLNSLFDGLYCVDLERRISFWNNSATRITGYASDEVLGSCCADNILRHVECDGKELCEGHCPLVATMQDGRMREARVFVHHKLGYRLPVQLRTAPVRNDDGVIVGAVEVFTDNSNAMEILEAFEKLKQEILIDPLTGIGNRRYGDMFLDSRLHEWETGRQPFGVLFIDIDHFKAVNDSHGHKIGDDVLKMAAGSMAGVFRKLDAVARWGGEEFIAVLPGANSATLSSIAERVRVMVERSFIILGGEKIGVTVSIGGTVAVEDDCASSIVARADAQMYRSKVGGRNMVSID